MIEIYRNNSNNNWSETSQEEFFQSHIQQGTPVYKYELGGVSLARINRAHNLSAATVSESNHSWIPTILTNADMAKSMEMEILNALGSD